MKGGMRRPSLLLLFPMFSAIACSAGPGEDASSSDDALTESCAYAAGAKARQTLHGVPAKIPIAHVIIVIQENRSFDHMFGSLRLEGHDVDGIPGDFVNKDTKGKDVHFWHRTDTCFDADSPHDEEALES